MKKKQPKFGVKQLLIHGLYTEIWEYLIDALYCWIIFDKVEGTVLG